MIITAGSLLGPWCFSRAATSEVFARMPRGNLTFAASGRAAILACAKSLRIPRESTVLLPSYICPAVLEPFRAWGCEMRFYAMSERLRPATREILHLLESGKVGLLFIIHYFGFPMPDFEEIIAACREREIPVIEDCAHALFSSYKGRLLGEQGDAAVFSLRKVLPLPEGGIAVIRGDSVESCRKPAVKISEIGKLLREGLYWAEASSGIPVRNYLLGHAGFRRWIEVRDTLPLNAMEAPMGKLSYWFLKKVPASEIIQRRRANYRYLVEGLITKGRKNNGLLLYDELPEGVCPVGLPILIEDRDRVRGALYRKGIGLRAYWDVLPKDVASFSGSQELSRRILVLPVHEGLRKKQLDVLIEELG